MPLNLREISQPTLLLNDQIAKANIERMQAKADTSGVQLRPHFKTHQSADIGEWFREAGTKTITVSSLAMADYFAKNGWQDILLAFPVNLRAVAHINKLAKKCRLGLVVESLEAVELLHSQVRAQVQIYLKIDVGTHRTGIEPDNTECVFSIIEKIIPKEHLHFSGLLAHAGHSYSAISRQEIAKIWRDSIQILQNLKTVINSKFNMPCRISVGDTPGCRIVTSFSGVDEVRPGNYVFYDVMQRHIGACAESDIAVALACPVVAKHADRRQIVVHGGAAHLSKDFILNEDQKPFFGSVCQLDENGWRVADSKSWITKVSQEHGIIQASEPLFHQTKIGDLLAILPIHSCLTANLMREYTTFSNQKISVMPWPYSF